MLTSGFARSCARLSASSSCVRTGRCGRACRGRGAQSRRRRSHRSATSSHLRPLEELCAREGLALETGRIAVAHTRDDRVETSLMRLAQGAGATGLTSLRPTRGPVVRPLFDCSRDEVSVYLERCGQSWREDASNTDTDRLRAKVRAELVPVFRDINPRFDESLARSLDILADEDDLLAEMAEAFVDDWIDVSEGEIAFDSRDAGNALEAHAAADAAARRWRGRSPRSHASISSTSRRWPTASDIDGFSHDLPGGVRAHDEYGRMVVSGSGGEPSRLASRILLDSGRARPRRCGHSDRRGGARRRRDRRKV